MTFLLHFDFAPFATASRSLGPLGRFDFAPFATASRSPGLPVGA
jgi:hypothetical protein